MCVCVYSFRIRGHPIFSYTILPLQGITVSICFLFRYVSLRFCSDSRTIKRCMVSYSGIVILRWWCQCFAFALEHITTFSVTIMRLLLLPLPLRVVAIVVVRIQMRFAFLVICSSVVRLVWMSLIALQPASLPPSPFSSFDRVQYAYTKNQPSVKLSCTIFPLNFSLLHVVQAGAKTLHFLRSTPFLSLSRERRRKNVNSHFLLTTFFYAPAYIDIVREAIKHLRNIRFHAT